MGKFYSTGVEILSATSIRITFVYRTVRCREILKLQSNATNLERAKNFRASILEAVKNDTFDYSVTFPNSPRVMQFCGERAGSGVTVAERFVSWMADQKKRIKASTYDGYRKIINQINPVIGDIVLTQLKRTDVKAWLQTLDVSNKRLTNIQSVLRAMLDDAVSDEILEVNPLFGWKYLNKDVIKDDDDIQPFTPEEQAAILKQLHGQGLNLIQFAFWTGLRTSELVGLEWGDIDWVRGIIHVRRALTQAATDVEVPKTKASRREVKLLTPARDALIRQKQYTFLADAAVFHNPRTDERWAGDAPIRQTLWLPALKKAGVAYRRPYQTRHTFASMMLTAGESPMWVAQQMGHKDWGMIQRTYGKWISAAQPDAGKKAEALFGIGGQEYGQKLGK